MMKKCMFALAIILFGWSNTYGQSSEIFIRYRKGATENDGALQIAQAVYESPKTKVKVVLYGVVHIADKAYYEKVQKDLNSYTAVLYERVGTPEEVEAAAKAGAGKQKAGLSEMQSFMCELLGLNFQMDSIDYKAKNLVHADMSLKKLKELLGSDKPGGKPIFPGMELFDNETVKQLLPLGKKLIGWIMENNPQFRTSLKLRLAQQMTQAADGKIPGMDPEVVRIILIERNKVAFSVLEKETAKRKEGTLGVFYGAAHMPDMHHRLLALGYKQTSKEWKTAWKIGSGAIGETKEEKKVPALPHSSKGSKWY